MARSRKTSARATRAASKVLIHRRGVIPVLLLLVLVLAGVVLQIVRGPAAATSRSRSPIAARPAPAKPTAQARAVVRGLAATRQATSAGSAGPVRSSTRR